MSLQSLRDGTQSKAIKVLIFFIILSFAGFGLESLLLGGAGTSVAEVNGVEITPQELQVAVENQKRQLMQIFGDNVEPAMLDDDRLRPRALENLIDRQLLLQEATHRGLTATDAAIGRVVASVDAFKVDGRFSPDQYKVVLANAGLTPERFRRSQSQELLLSQLETALINSDFVTSVELAAAADVTAEERDVRYLLTDEQGLKETINIRDETIEAFYEANKANYVTDEQVIAEYVVLSVDDFREPVDPAFLDEQFESVKNDYEVSEQALVSHILLIQGDNETAADYAGRVDNVSQRLTAGEDFTQLARELSDDIGSAALGGELGFTDGSAFPEPMEAAIASLEVGGISEAVVTDAGTHFIRLEERVSGEAADYAALRAELEESIQLSNAQQELLVAVDALRDLSFNSVDLKGPASALGLQAQLSTPVSRDYGEALFASQSVRSALFSEDVYGLGNNSDVIELGSDRFVALRVAEKIAPEQLPLETVAEGIKTSLEEQALESRRDELLAEVRLALDQGESIESIAADKGWEWRVELDARRAGSLLPREVAQAAFSLAFTPSSDVTRVSLPGGLLAIVELADVTPGSVNNLSAAEQTMMVEQLASLNGQVGALEYRRALRKNGQVITR